MEGYIYLDSWGVGPCMWQAMPTYSVIWREAFLYVATRTFSGGRARGGRFPSALVGRRQRRGGLRVSGSLAVHFIRQSSWARVHTSRVEQVRGGHAS